MQEFKKSIDHLRDEALLWGLNSPQGRTIHGEQNARRWVLEMDDRIDLSEITELARLDFPTLKIFAAIRSPRALAQVGNFIQQHQEMNIAVPPTPTNADWSARAAFFAKQIRLIAYRSRNWPRLKVIKRFHPLRPYQQTRKQLFGPSPLKIYECIDKIAKQSSLRRSFIRDILLKGQKYYCLCGGHIGLIALLPSSPDNHFRLTQVEVLDSIKLKEAKIFWQICTRWLDPKAVSSRPGIPADCDV